MIKRYVLLCLMVWSGFAFGQFNWNTTLVSRVAAGPVNTSFIVGNTAYVGDGGLVIYNISTPTSPAYLGEVPSPSKVTSIYVQGNYAYVAAEFAGLQIIDVSNTASPQEVGFFNTHAGLLQDVQVSGNYAYVLGYFGGFYILDISNPASPQQVGHFNSAASYGFAIDGNHVYIAEGFQGLRILDVSNPASPQEVTLFNVGNGWAEDVAISGNHAYVLADDAFSTTDLGFKVVDISNPASPQIVGEANSAGRSVAINGSDAYVAGGGNLIQVIDVSNATAPVQTANIPGDAADVYISGSNAYLGAEGDGLVIVDITNASAPQIVTEFFTGDASLNVFVDEVSNYSFEATGRGGIRVTDVTDPASLQGIGDFFRGNFATDVFVDGNLYVTDSLGLLVIMDVSNLPNDITVLSTISTPGQAAGVYVSGNYAYVADGDSGMRVIDVSNPANPQEVGAYPTPNGAATDVHVAGNYAYLVDFSGMHVVDVSNPANPQQTSFYDNNGSGASGVYINGNHAYLTDFSFLNIVDISNPASPQAMGSSFAPLARNVSVSGNHAYVVADTTGLLIFDISDPANPMQVAGYNTGDAATGIFTSGNLAYVADKADGLYLIRNDLVTGIEDKENEAGLLQTYLLEQNYPNPFNPETSIRFALPQASDVTLKIYNVAGQLVNTLVSEHKNAGSHTVAWNGRSSKGQQVASGLYFYQITAGEFQQTKQMILLK